MLKILLPITLPSARSACPASADTVLTAISGALVPKATTVRPITKGEMPNAAASFDAPRTSTSAPTVWAVWKKRSMSAPRSPTCTQRVGSGGGEPVGLPVRPRPVA